MEEGNRQSWQVERDREMACEGMTSEEARFFQRKTGTTGGMARPGMT
jgi:hypothetical protein